MNGINGANFGLIYFWAERPLKRKKSSIGKNHEASYINSKRTNMIYFQHLRKFVRKMRFLFLAAVTVCFTFIPVALAVTPDPALVKAATAAGADRTNSLIDGAKKEGQLTFYTSAPVDDVIAVT